MIISFKTLKNYIDISKDQFLNVGSNLHKLGFELNSITDNSSNNLFVVGKILSCEKHKNSESLFICKVRIGNDEILNIVCAASNITKSKWVVVARSGAKMYSGLEIVVRKIKGVISEGMICALTELNYYSQENTLENQIYEINNRNAIYKPGDYALEILELDDIIIDCEPTYNLHNELGIYHVATRIAQEYKLKIYCYSKLKTRLILDKNQVSIHNQTKKYCQNVGWATVKKVNVVETPKWIKNILWTYCIKQISPLVDLTNLVMLELNQPMHAYDLDEIADTEIIFVKNHFNNHKLVDFINYSNIDCAGLYVAITQQKKNVLGILGFTGAIFGSISSKTKSIVIESSCFVDHMIRNESKKSKIKTQASALFSKPMHEHKIKHALQRFCALGVKLNYFKNFSSINFTSKAKLFNTWSLSLGRIKQLIGLDISKTEVNNSLGSIFTSLEWLTLDKFIFQVPAWRIDLENENAIIEQIMKNQCIHRKISKDILEATQENFSIQAKPKLRDETTLKFQLQKDDKFFLLSRLLIFSNFFEVHLFSLSSIVKNRFVPFKNHQKPVIIINPISDNYSQYREYLFYQHLNIVIENWNKNLFKTNFFEINSIYFQDALNQFKREKHLCISHGGELNYTYKKFERLNYSLQVIRDKFLKIMSMMDVDIGQISFKKSENIDWFNQNNYHEIYFQQEFIGFCGQIKSQMLNDAKKDRRLFILEINIDLLFRVIILEELELPNNKKLQAHISFQKPSTSKLQEHWLTFYLETNSYDLTITNAISIIRRQYEVIWEIQIVDCFYSKDARKSAVTIKLLFDFKKTIQSKHDIEKILWKIKRHFESIINKYETKFILHT